MARELITAWSGYQQAIDRLLGMARAGILIYDEDLDRLRLDQSSRLEAIKRILSEGGTRPRIRIALRQGENLLRQHPLLVNLMSTHGHLFAVQQTPAELAHLRDAMMIVDGEHGLIRFEKEQARSKLLLGEKDELAGYGKRFEEIWAAGGEGITPRPLGL